MPDRWFQLTIMYIVLRTISIQLLKSMFTCLYSSYIWPQLERRSLQFSDYLFVPCLVGRPGRESYMKIKLFGRT